ncbi:hypothetical protein LHJ74_23325 [Streptomyces sp. N2-109]|uniref:Secreted protein n=1 Tax=Streptomyces gossypii TaxID=2883101 RepID=A0ABT2JY38_9ACTN|nr:hypothetical protein [Streptomyces gossypii]MCT2592808.1 hypothetical protein [Streptomyces gossypii]
MAYLESRKNLTGGTAGVVGLGLTFAGVAGAYWPVVVAGLYGAGALIAPPERPAAPDFPDPTEQLDALRADFATLRDYLAKVELPPPADGRLLELDEVLAALLDPDGPGGALTDDPEALHALRRIISQDVPEVVDTFVRIRWWTRLAPGGEPPELHLERQLGLLHYEAAALASMLRAVAERHQQTLEHYLEERRRSE